MANFRCNTNLGKATFRGEGEASAGGFLLTVTLTISVTRPISEIFSQMWKGLQSVYVPQLRCSPALQLRCSLVLQEGSQEPYISSRHYEWYLSRWLKKSYIPASRT